jgi:hypothetical protein
VALESWGEYEVQITAALEAASVVVVIWSEGAAASNWVYSEAKVAICRSSPPGYCRLDGRQYPAATLDEVKPPRPSAGSRQRTNPLAREGAGFEACGLSAARW